MSSNGTIQYIKKLLAIILELNSKSTKVNSANTNKLSNTISNNELFTKWYTSKMMNNDIFQHWNGEVIVSKITN